MNRYNRFKQASKILKNPMCYDHVQYRAAKRMAIRALRKETPTIPLRKIYNIGRRSGTLLTCGRCSKVICSNDRYCPRCGQRIAKIIINVERIITESESMVGLVAYSFYFEKYIRCTKYNAADDWYFVFVDAPDMEPLRAGSPHHCFRWAEPLDQEARA